MSEFAQTNNFWVCFDIDEITNIWWSWSHFNRQTQFFDKKVILSVKDNTHSGSNKKLIYFDQPKFLFTTFLLINVIITMG